MNKTVIELYIQPNSKKSKVAGYFDKLIKIQISSPPVDNAANKELIKFLSKKLNLNKSKIKIIKGEKSRIKTVEIQSDKNKDEIENLLLN